MGQKGGNDVIIINYLSIVRRGNLSLDSQHFSNGIFISVFSFKILPLVPKGDVNVRVANVGAVSENGARSVNFADFHLELGVAQAHFAAAVLVQHVDRLLVDGAARGQAVQLGRSSNIDRKHFQLFRFLHLMSFFSILTLSRFLVPLSVYEVQFFCIP